MLMLTPFAAHHANNIKLLHSFIQNEPVFEEHCMNEVKLHLKSFETKYREEMLEELSDVCLGVDTNGLDLLIRLKGPNRC